MKIKIINLSNNPVPKYYSNGSSGLDLMANLTSEVIIKPFERILISTGIKIELPNGYEGQVRSRSGMALKFGIICLNSPGTIDSDYRGEIKIILANFSKDNFKIKNGDRIAQLVISKYEKIEFIEVNNINFTDRSSQGFGSTGISLIS